MGKTTSAINLGLALSKLGAEVVVVDGNLSSPNISIHLGQTYFPITLHDVMHADEPIQKAIYKHASGLSIIPAEISVDSMRLIDFEKLKRHLQDLHLLAEYVIIDGSPGLGKETKHLLDLSDEIVVVTNADKPSIIDAKRLISFAKRLGVTITGIIVTKYKKRSYRLSLEEVETYLGMPVLVVVPEDKRFEKSIHKRKPFLHMYPRRKASKAYHKLASIISNKVKIL